MYSFLSKVRYSETDHSKHLNLYSIVNYFQDCSTFHSEASGLGIDELYKKQKAWMLSAWQIHICRFPKLFEDIIISTWPYGFNGMYAYRNFTISSSNGSVLIAANSIWIYFNLLTGHPCRITEADVSPYGIGEPYDMKYESRRISIPNNMEHLSSFKIPLSVIDTNMHVNNSAYIRMASELCPIDFKAARLRAEYKKAAYLSDIIYPSIAQESSRVVVCLSNAEGIPYTVLEFISDDVRTEYDPLK